MADAVALSPDAPLLATRGEQSGRHGARRHAAWSHSRLARRRARRTVAQQFIGASASDAPNEVEQWTTTTAPQ